MFCENCGNQLPENSTFCSECGSKVSFMGNEKQINEEIINTSNEPSPRRHRGPVPPVMRQTAPRQPAEPYRRESGSRQVSESYIGGVSDIIGFGQYVFMIFISGIPIINIILLLKWAFNKQKPNKSNFAKALLFYCLIAVIIYVAYIWLWLKATSSI